MQLKHVDVCRFFSAHAHVYECVFCRGLEVLCRRVFPECGGSERRFGYMEHSGPFFMVYGCTHAHTAPLHVAPSTATVGSLLQRETNRVIHSTDGLNVIKIYRSWVGLGFFFALKLQTGIPPNLGQDSEG